MARKEISTLPNWDDPDEAAPWSPEVFARAEISKGDKIVRPATGTLTRGRPKSETTMYLCGWIATCWTGGAPPVPAGRRG